MQIKWIIENPAPDQIRGHLAFDESGRYQITFDLNEEKFYLYDHKPKMIGVPNPYLLDRFDIKGLSDVTLSDVLIKMHRKIERYNHYSHIHTCGKCRQLIFKDYKAMKGFCDLCRIDRNFEDRCIYEEEMS